VHPYSTDESRVPVYSGLAVLSVVLSWAVAAATSSLSWPEWLISAPSLAAMYAVLYRLFDAYAWKWPLLHALGSVKVMNIAGNYDGKLVSTFHDADGKPIERHLTLRITQSWTRIAIEMTITSGSSSSMSVSALGSVMHDGSATCLTYIYRNKVNPAIADSDMGDHDGTAELRIYADGHVTGRYFNSRPRAGTIEARRR
jgi:hypothetical protein